jgi:hypothetical protein
VTAALAKVKAGAALAAALTAALAAVLQTPSPPPNWMKTRLATSTTATRSGLGQGQHAPEVKYLEMLVVLRMNRKFMEDMREHYGK